MNKKLKIVALACSPSKGYNSDTMLDSFIEGIKSYDQFEVEKFYMYDIPIDMYTYENRDSPEPHEKEFEMLSNQIQIAKGLVIATPTYNFSVPAPLKNFIDRMRFFALDFEHKNNLGQPVGLLNRLRTYFIVSGGSPTWAEKLLFFAFPPFWLRNVFLYYGSMCLGAYYTGDTMAHKNKKILKKCKKQGQKFARKILKRQRNRLLERLFWRPPQIN